MLEGPATLGVALFLIFGLQNVLVASLATVWIGIGVTRPRAEWFDTRA